MSTSSVDFAHIGKSVCIKGELSGSEDIYLDGEVEGSIHLTGNSLTVGPNGRVRADVSARNVIVSGSLTGNIQASERTEFRKSATVSGDVQTRRIAIEDGAYFKGKLEILVDAKPAASVATVASSSTVPAANPAGQPK